MFEWLSVLFQAIMAAGVGLLAWQTQVFQRTLQYQGLNDVLKVQNDRTFKKQVWIVCSRRPLRDVKSKADINALPAEVLEALREVTNRLDDVGFLIETKCVLRNAFMAKYFERVLICGAACKSYIVTERQGARGQAYQEHFTRLVEAADSFRGLRNPAFDEFKALEDNYRAYEANLPAEYE